MKRKTYHNRLSVLISVERDRWRDFQELCDNERKSSSVKIDELISEELQKNALGDKPNAIGVCYNDKYVFNPKKSSQSDIRQWIEVVHENKDNPTMLTQIVNISNSCAATARAYINQFRRFRKQ